MITRPLVNGLKVTTFRGVSVIGVSLKANQDAIFKALMGISYE